MDQRLRSRFYRVVLQLAVYLDVDRLMTMRTFRGDDAGEPFSSQVPLHEGHSNGINGSGGVDSLARAEGHMVRRVVGRHWICPRNRSLLVPE